MNHNQWECSTPNKNLENAFRDTAQLFEVNKINQAKNMLPTNNLEVQALNTFLQVLPNAVQAFCKCDEIITDHQEKQALKYSEQEYIKAIHRMYQAGKITGQQAKEAIGLVFQQSQVVQAKKVDPVEQEISNMLNIPIQ